MQAAIGEWMQTVSGGVYWPLDPRPQDVKIEDIAHGLSMMCRFNGHVRRFYSVAEHSLLVSMQVPSEHALQGLLHDATEAYLADVIRPIKSHLTNYQELEHRNWVVIAGVFGVPVTLAPEVKHADNTVLLAEKAALMDPSPIAWEWAAGLEPAPVRIQCLRPSIARYAFLKRFAHLMRGR